MNGRLHRGVLAFGVALPLLAVLLGPAATPAFATYGRGVYGEISDKVVTYAGLSMIAFFPIFVFVASRILYFLEQRKERKQAFSHAVGNGKVKGGW